MDARRSEVEIACELLKLLDGLTIEKATNALGRAQSLLLTTQIVSSKSPILAVASENAAALQTR
jgi:hypothetical protein